MPVPPLIKVVAFLAAMLPTASWAGTADDINALTNVASRVAPIIGAASSCQSIDQSRVQNMVAQFRAMLKSVSPSDADRQTVAQMFDRYVLDGRSAVAAGQITCKTTERQLADLEQSVFAPDSPTPSTGAPGAPAAPSAAATPAPADTQPSATRGITDREIRFGIVAPFSGVSRDLGRQMEIGITTAFNKVNDAGGVEGRQLHLIHADDGYEPTRTLAAMRQLYEKDRVFANIGNVGTPTTAVALPYAIENRAILFGAFTGAPLLRNRPPDRYVFNYRASYEEETGAVVRYLLKVRRLQPSQIAVFAQQDAYGDAGFAGVQKAYRQLGLNDSAILRVNYKRNTIDVDDAIKTLRGQKHNIGAVVMVATYRAAAKFIEKTRDLMPNLVYTNVSFVGSSELASELKLLGPRYTQGVIVTQVVPAVGGYSSIVLEFKNALNKYFQGEPPTYVSLEGYIAANILIEGLKRAGPQPDTEKLVDALDSMRDLDLGLGAPLGFSRSEHQASHRVWATMLDANGNFLPLDLE
ncbi:MAG: ABC transporter substrate-binding protein [Alphaproteobacteria bacterium]|nr:ABC transporter substrate-binding protein [Alphaproteobacteria bacterium]